MFYTLPTALTVGGQKLAIDSDWRTALDCLEALHDADLTDVDRAVVVLGLLYREPAPTDALEDALRQAMCYLSGGSERSGKPGPRLMDWEQDFTFVVSAVNRVAGREIRELPYMHWWTFLGYYGEIGDSTFAQIIRIRQLKAKHKKLDKTDAQWYRENRDIVDLKVKYTDAEADLFKRLGV